MKHVRFVLPDGAIVDAAGQVPAVGAVVDIEGRKYTRTDSAPASRMEGDALVGFYFVREATADELGLAAAREQDDAAIAEMARAETARRNADRHRRDLEAQARDARAKAASAELVRKIRIVLGNLQMIGAITLVILLMKTGASGLTVSVAIATGLLVILSMYLFKIRRYGP